MTGQVERLYNPRAQSWHEHFSFQGTIIRGLSTIGRATVETLKFNAIRKVQLRAELLDRGEL